MNVYTINVCVGPSTYYYSALSQLTGLAVSPQLSSFVHSATELVECGFLRISVAQQ